MTEQELIQKTREQIEQQLKNYAIYARRCGFLRQEPDSGVLHGCVDSILSIPNIAVVDREAKLPDIPSFGYDDINKIPILQRGAVNYSKLISDGYVKEVKKP